MAPLSLYAKASTSTLTRLSGLSHGTKPLNCILLHPCKMLVLVVVLMLMGVNTVMSLKSDFDVVINMVQRSSVVQRYTYRIDR